MALQGERQEKEDPALLFYSPGVSYLDFPLARPKQKSESKRSHRCSQSIEISLLGQRTRVKKAEVWVCRGQ